MKIQVKNQSVKVQSSTKNYFFLFLISFLKNIIINAITIIAGIKTIILMMKSANHFAKLDKFCRADVNESFIFQDSPVIGTCSFKFKFISDVSVVFER